MMICSMHSLLLLSLLAAILVVLPGEADDIEPNPCGSAEGGNATLDIACWGHTSCIDGKLTKFVCPDGQVLDADNMECVDQGSTVCDANSRCNGLPSGSYPLITCQSFSCVDGKYNGSQNCPANQLYNQALKICEDSTTVLPPCGFTPPAPSSENTGSESSSCEGAQDMACWGYTSCVDGEPIKFFCPDGQLLDQENKQCVEQEGSECDTNSRCNGLPTGHYPVTSCESFFSCTGGTYMGMQNCAANLLYDMKLKVCVNPETVTPPCGFFSENASVKAAAPHSWGHLSQWMHYVVLFLIIKCGLETAPKLGCV